MALKAICRHLPFCHHGCLGRMALPEKGGKLQTNKNATTDPSTHSIQRISWKCQALRSILTPAVPQRETSLLTSWFIRAHNQHS